MFIPLRYHFIMDPVSESAKKQLCTVVSKNNFGLFLRKKSLFIGVRLISSPPLAPIFICTYMLEFAIATSQPTVARLILPILEKQYSIYTEKSFNNSIMREKLLRGLPQRHLANYIALTRNTSFRFKYYFQKTGCQSMHQKGLKIRIFRIPNIIIQHLW